MILLNVREEVIAALEESGIFAYDGEIKDNDLFRYDMDSLTFVNFIVSIEERLGICIPDEYIRVDVLQSLDGFIVLLEHIVDETNMSRC